MLQIERDKWKGQEGSREEEGAKQHLINTHLIKTHLIKRASHQDTHTRTRQERHLLSL